MKMFSIVFVGLSRLAIIAALTSVAVGAAQVDIGVPATNTPNATLYEPFAPEALGNQSIRYQQVYDASAFSSLGSGGGFISNLVFSAAGRRFGATLPSIEIVMSVTLREPDQLSSVFADNLGIHTSIVYAQGPLTLIGGGSPTPVFEPHITLTTPFYYNPAEGNLLIEIRNYARIPGFPIGGAPTWVGSLSALNVAGDPVSRVYAFDVNATSGSLDTYGLHTLFEFNPVPEPSTWALLAVGFLALLAARRRIGKRKEARHVAR